MNGWKWFRSQPWRRLPSLALAWLPLAFGSVGYPNRSCNDAAYDAAPLLQVRDAQNPCKSGPRAVRAMMYLEVHAAGATLVDRWVHQNHPSILSLKHQNPKHRHSEASRALNLSLPGPSYVILFLDLLSFFVILKIVGTEPKKELRWKVQVN